MINPWVLLNKDIHWVFTHLHDITFEFLLKDTISPIHNNNDHGRRQILDIQRVKNDILNKLYLTTVTFLTLPAFVLYPILMMKALIKEEVRPPTQTRLSKHIEEKWFFINGILTTEEGLDENCMYLEERFDRGVTGILNRSYGIFWDMVEVVLGRNFNVETISVLWAVDRILEELKNNRVKTIRLIAHSQGGIIANLVLEKLYIELSKTGHQKRLEKLEVYTFASASREFINPGKLVSRIEHYAN